MTAVVIHAKLLTISPSLVRIGADDFEVAYMMVKLAKQIIPHMFQK
jgi:hypothetical protein